ncbi:hypothetical protein [Exiguobacterium sp. 17-1]|uniref:hypothetical protein n=1 Tax=Exiguobacterium sp. 17-1 TaxID=2931981 RepID=UPI001FFE8DAF|nr:hypothetical protein [Exiguobacterium sp. 17-1]MCK2156416.1 hypothetical protein [Exiguobacterium sp. 17-1]
MNRPIRYINFGDDVRLRYRKSFQGIYKELAGDHDTGKEGILFQDNGELFLFCAMLAINKGEKSESILETTAFRFSSIKSNELRTIYFLIAISDQDGLNADKFNDVKSLKSIVESYADRGMEILWEELLKDYFTYRDNHYTFIGDSKTLDFQKSWLQYLM